MQINSVITGKNDVTSVKFLHDTRSNIIRKIKKAVEQLVDNPEMESKTLYSEFISKRANKSYRFLNHLFMKDTGMDIEKYFVVRKIEKAKELLEYYRLTPIEIVYQLNFKSMNELQYKYKMVTGNTL